jgi:hypothetical protein
MNQADASIDPRETLCVPKKRRFMHEYVATEEGNRELRIYFGLKEITFDEPEFIAFGEHLIKQDRFVASSATAWSGGEPYPWDRVKEMLEALLDEGVIERGEKPSGAPGRSDLYAGFLAQEERRVAPEEPLWWNPGCPEVMRRLAGRALEIGYLETVMPVHRVAHPALDADGRQVGEINVFPDSMRLKMPTEWRACPYAGSRHQDDMPMNVTALQAMRRVWQPVLEASLSVRDAFLERYPKNADGTWRLGDLHACSCAALALPTFMMMRAANPVENGRLDPVLSSLFRVVDGVRIVTLFLLFLPERPLTYDAPMAAEKLHYLTERDNHLLSTRGVCAGPPNMIDEFFGALVDDKPLAKGRNPLPTEWAEALPAAIDYGLLGIQLYSVIFSLWGRMCATYERIRWALTLGEAANEASLDRLRGRLEADWTSIIPGRLHWEVQRAWAEARYGELFERTQPGVRGAEGAEVKRLADVLRPAPGLLGGAAPERFREVLSGGAESAVARAALGEVADALLDYLRVERSALGEIDAIQRKINALLGREHPTRPLSGNDLALHHALRVRTIGGMPYLLDLFDEQFGLRVENTAGATRVERHGSSSDLG